MNPLTPLRRLTAALLLLGLLVFQPASSIAAGWDMVSDRVNESTTIMYIQRGAEFSSCTAFSINETLKYYMTAAHCLGDAMSLDGFAVEALYIDETNDLLVVQGKVARPALRPGRKPQQGDAIGAFGYAWGIAPRFHVGYVAAVDYDVSKLTDDVSFHGPWLAMGFSLIGGMSGGPVVDRQSRVVAINQWALDGEDAGFGRAIDVIWKSTAKFWQYQPIAR